MLGVAGRYSEHGLLILGYGYNLCTTTFQAPNFNANFNSNYIIYAFKKYNEVSYKALSK